MKRYPLSATQSAIWFDQQLQSENALYNIGGYFSVHGKLDVSLLKQAFQLVINASDALRAAFGEENGTPYQYFQDSYTKNIPYIDLSSHENAMSLFLEEVKSDNAQQISFDEDFLFKLKIYQLSNDEAAWYFKFHHIIIDGFGISLFVKQISQTYTQLAQGENPTIETPAYTDFIASDLQYFTSPSFTNDGDYWRKEFTPLPEPIPLKTLTPNTSNRNSKRLDFNLNKAAYNQVVAFCEAQGVSVFHYLLGLLHVYARQCWGTSEWVIGLPLLNRNNKTSKNTIGLFTAVMPFKMTDNDGSFSSLMLHTKGQLRAHYRHQRYPLASIHQNINLHTTGRTSMFDVSVSFQKHDYEHTLNGVNTQLFSLHQGSDQHALAIQVGEWYDNRDVVISLDYQTDYWSDAAIKLFQKRFLALFTNLKNEADKELSQLTPVNAQEKTQLIQQFDNLEVGFPEQETLVSLFEKQVAIAPDTTAVVFKQQTLSYASLNQQANALAQVLVQKGITQGDLIAVLMDKSTSMIVALMGILKAGAAYVPIDPDYPAERINFMLSDSESKVLLVNGNDSDIDFKGAVINLQDLNLDEAVDTSKLPVVTSDTPAYVIYTSGSTGTPKGVLISHQNVVRLMVNDAPLFDFGANDVWTMFHSYCFDFSVWEMYGALLFGGKLVVINKETARDTQAYLQVLKDEQVTVLNQTPGAFNNLSATELQHASSDLALRYVIFGGEVLSPKRLQGFKEKYPHTKLINMYGITETTVHVTFKEITDYDITNNISCIGKPIPTLALYVMDKNLNIQPIGVPGEICVAGKGLSSGYLNNPDITQERFVDHPFMAGEKLYRSGDLARYLDNGDIEYLGRIDYQVKIRGFRIELGEIEAALQNHPLLDQVLVIDKEKNNEKYLVAYYTAPKAVELAAIKAHLAKTLPDYMIPAFFMHLAHMPLTSNGKVDRKNLPDPEVGHQETYVAPYNDMEKAMVEIWQDILDIPNIGVTDNFFDLGGHSLKATQFMALLSKKYQVSITLKQLFNTPTIQTLATVATDLKNTIPDFIALTDTKKHYPLSTTQNRMFILNQVSGSDVTYNMCGKVCIKGKLNHEKVKRAFIALINRHESLRTSFVLNDSHAVQIIKEVNTFSIPFLTVTREEVPNILQAFIQPFQLAEAPLLRIKVLTIHEQEHIMLMDMHHIIGDGISMQVLLQDFAKLYDGEALTPLPVQYKDYVAWQHNRLHNKDVSKHKNYWLTELSNSTPALLLPLDYPRPSLQSFEGDKFTFPLDKELWDSLKSLSRENNTTLFLTLMAAFKVLLQKLTSQDEIVIGTPVSTRKHVEVENLIGIFVNTIPIRSFPTANQSFVQYLSELQEASLQAFECSDYPMEDLIEEIPIQRNMSRNPLFDVVFVLQNEADLAFEINQLSFKTKPVNTKTAKFDLNLIVTENGKGAEACFEYCTHLFAESTMARWASHFTTLLKSIISQPNKTLASHTIQTTKEKKALIQQFDNLEVGFPTQETLLSLFEKQVEIAPQATAVVFKQQTLSYASLNQQANALAQELAQQGIVTGDLVAVLMDKSTSMIVALMGILKAGAAYVPIDPDYPAERINFMLSDSQSKVLLVNGNELDIDFKGEVINIQDLNLDVVVDTSILPVVTSENSAYVIYTSGSTGTPKGVLISHQNVVRLMVNDAPLFDFGANDAWTMFHSYCFDFSVWEMYGALLFGGKLVIIDKETARDTHVFLQVLKNQQVTVLNQTPGAFNNLSETELQQETRELALRYVVFGGEALSPKRLQGFKEKYPNTKLINMYGITETTVHVTYKEITDHDINNNISCIGKPIPTLAMYVMDNNLNIQPIGVPGEICVAGKGLSSGYLNNPDITQERFVEHPFIAGEKLYRSGDLARYLDNGDIEYVGRIDYQVKIRGFRIELGEIESALQNHTQLDQVLVLDKEKNNEKYLVAYYTATEAIELSALKVHLAKTLPDYMIPAFFVYLTHMPLTSNGKVDRKNLPDPEVSIQEKYLAPTTEAEKVIAQCFASILQLEKVGKHDNYFELGGDSIKAIRLINEINQALSSNIMVVDLFKNPAVQELAVTIQNKSTTKELKEQQTIKDQFEKLKVDIFAQNPSLTSQVEDVFPMSDIELGMMYYTLKSPGDSIYHDQQLWRIKETTFEKAAFEQAWDLMVEKHQILRTSFDVKTYGQPVQFVHPSFKTSVAYVDLSSQTEAEIESYIQQWLHNDRAKPFEISFGNPLWRLMVLRYNETDLDIIMSCHHAIVDGWSYASLMTELSNTYQQLKSQPNYRPKSLLSTYKDYVLRQQWVKESAEINAFWKSELAGFNRLSLPFKNNSDDRAFCGSYMDGNLGNLVLTYAKANKISPRVVYFSAYAYLMKLMSYESDLVVGLVEHGRPSVPDADKLVACFLNTIPVRIDFTKVDSWQSYVMMVDKKLRELKQYGELPLAEIAKNAGLANQQNPLFDTHFTYVDFHVTQDNDQDLVANSQHSANNFVKTNTYFDFIVSASYNQLGVGIQFADALFSKDEANQLIKVYTAILTELVSNQEQALFPPTVLAQFPSFSSELNAISPTPAELPHLAEALASQLKAYTNHIAISENGQDYSYEALNQRSDVIACHLIAMGVKAQDNILLLLPNSFEAVATILACIKSNIVYVPVDVDYPHARIAYMAADAEVKAIVSQSLITAAFDSFLCPVVLLDELSTTAHTPLPPVERNNSDLAYILYTSGSTGKPKGAMITQQGLFNYCQWAAETYVGEDKACFPLYSSLAFDLTVTSVFVPLLTGNRMAVYHSSRKEALIQDIINDKQATIIKLTPAHLQVLNELDVSDSTITKIIVGGEALKAHLAQSITTKFGNKVAIFNEYGPTETTVGCSIYLHDYQTDKQNSIPIGVPIKNTALSIVDNRQHAMLKGCLGEILIGGDGVARGYLNRPDLTREKFLTNKGIKQYRSGDLGYLNTHNQLVYQDRIDHQVKIRGFRIELGEIEAVLLQHPNIKEVIVLDREKNAETYLAAYYTSTQTITQAELTAHLLTQLPEYMVPSFMIPMESMPLTPNGKIDRKSLPSIETTSLKVYEAPTTELEKSLVDIWQELLQVERVGISDNFFDIGGHSLKATLFIARLYQALHVDLPLRTMFEKPSIKQLAPFIESLTTSAKLLISPAPKQDTYPASTAQKRLFILNQLTGNNVSYNTPFGVTVTGSFDVTKATQAIKQLMARHESLRTSFDMKDGEVITRIHENIDYTPMVHASNIIDTQQFIHPFDLSKAPLFRCDIVPVSATEHQLYFDMHHIISDGVSAQILVKEFSELYAGAALAPLSIQYKDYAVWQNNNHQQVAWKTQKQFWQNTLKNIPVLELPYDYPRPAAQQFQGDTLFFTLDNTHTQHLKKLANDTSSTLFMVLLAAYQITLHKYSQQDDIVVGTPVAGRNQPGLAEVVGMFVNTLPIRNFPTAQKTIASFLSEIKQTTLDAFEHQDVSLDEVMEDLSLPRDMSRNPLFDAVFVLQNTGNNTLQADGLNFEPIALKNNTAKFDLTLSIQEIDGTLACSLEYSTALFKRASIQRMSQQLGHVVSQLSLKQTIGSISLNTETEKNQLIQQFDNQHVGFPEQETLHSLFEKQVELNPQATAVVFKQQTLSYRELNQQANALAQVLVQQGIVAGDLVAVLMDKSTSMIVALMGILKAGAAYVPIDPDYPADRIIFMLSDSQSSVLLMDGTEQKVDFKGEIINLQDLNLDVAVDTSILPVVTSETPAYVIYTSGSTGTPKGVLISHQNVVRLMVNDAPLFDFGANDVWTMFHSYCFDFSVWEMYGALLFGGKLVVIDKETARDTQAYLQVLKDQQVTILNQTPGAFNNLSATELQHTSSDLALRYVIFGGEALSPKRLKGFKEKYPHTKLINMYGITETTVHVTYKEITNHDIENNISCIGKPIPTMAVYVMDESLNIQPIGVPGEICVAGKGLSIGYLNNPTITQERFVDHPFMAGEKLYRSGDLARYLDNGDIEYLGRIDYQVKIRGFRIELGEIEAALQNHPQLDQVLVIDKEKNNEKYLVAYYTAAEAFELAALKAHVANTLPDYMIPAFFVHLTHMPLTSNGKVDRKNLPDPEVGHQETYVAPSTDLEKAMVEIWQDILDIPRVGITDNFFDLGGHSLKATSMIAHVSNKLHKTLTLREFFLHPTITELAHILETKQASLLPAIAPAEEASHYPLSHAQKGIWLSEQVQGSSAVYHIPITILFKESIQTEALQKAFAAVIQKHESLRTYFFRVDDEPRQQILPKVDFEMPILDFSKETHTSTAVTKAMQAQTTKPFDLQQAPLMHAALIRVADQQTVLCLNMHHIITDGWSMPVMFNDIMEHYRAITEQIDLPKSKLTVQYKDYAIWQQNVLKSETGDVLRNFWTNQLSGTLTNLAITPDFERPATKTQQGKMMAFSISNKPYEDVKAYLNKQNTTPFVFMQTAIKLLLHRLTACEDIIIGTPVAGRVLQELEQQIGNYVNMIPLRSNIDPSSTFESLLMQVHHNTLLAFEHQLYPFDYMVQDLAIKPDKQRAPLFNIGLTWQTFDAPQALDYEWISQTHETAKYELWFFGQESDGAFEMSIEYNTDLYQASTMEVLIEKIHAIIDQVISNPNIQLNQVVMSEEAPAITDDTNFDFNF